MPDCDQAPGYKFLMKKKKKKECQVGLHCVDKAQQGSKLKGRADQALSSSKAQQGSKLKGRADQALSSSTQLGVKDVEPHSGSVQLP
jgi:hypothetical protein